MTRDLESYESIRKWKEAHIEEHAMDTLLLNKFHDYVMCLVFEAAVAALNVGSPPSDYCWFITGSGGRMEQGVFSDQDHGIIFAQNSKENEAFFLALGKEISYGLHVVGYPYCEGKVMCSNPMWCKSIAAWREQLGDWMEDRSLESIRNLQIFFDARCLLGKGDYIKELKNDIFEYRRKQPQLLSRLMESVMHIKNAIGPLGQLIPINQGKYQGSIDLKYTAFLPYVNGIRLLAIKEGLDETSTLGRIDALLEHPMYAEVLSKSKQNFKRLLFYRLSMSNRNSYEDTHFLMIKHLDKWNRKEIKQILKDGKRLHQYISRHLLS
ncbi:DUF294 nucleotidyltransferase-like domain-containing protein [Bacillus tuaregi]|uniref:DUF294 nucleotidyltransferase-like domain-containing protein n=1 Tax=Bacillus tuaregi TaxID=1816695 RepID=UPI0008F8A1B8|nr:DUF294 nucleotidyltransferase-like domain-containing protein [Bacillus tuaregi]